MADDSLFLIDIDKILREKAPKQAKYVPRFVVSYLKRIVHQEELNVFLRGAQDKVGVDFLKASLDFLDALPLASLGFGWVLPAAVCGAIGALVPVRRVP